MAASNPASPILHKPIAKRSRVRGRCCDLLNDHACAGKKTEPEADEKKGRRRKGNWFPLCDGAVTCQDS